VLRILHVGLGPLGLKIVADLHERGLGEVVAAVDVSPEIAGKKLSELVPEARAKTVVQKSLDEIRDWKSIDAAIVTTSSSLETCAPTFRELLMRGVSVVSTCEELAWPTLKHEKLAAELDLLARENRGRLLGTGVNPGFLMDAFPAFATSVSKSIQRIEVVRRQDASIRRIPFQKKIGAGLTEAELAREVAAGRIRHVGLPESLHFLAHVLGIALARWEESIHPILAERNLESGLGPIPKGRVCGVRQDASGFDASGCRIRLDFAAAIGLADPHDRVVVHGEPPIDLVWKGGVPGDVATSSIVLNAVRPLLASQPGLHTMATIPLVRCAQAPPTPPRAARRPRTAATPPRT
jgi:4-hydroxy-tetrahydrodipicolinate reductase